MKIDSPYFRLTVVTLICITVFSTVATAQKNGILPLTGMRCYYEGFAAGNIDVSIDGAQLLSNSIPLNREIVVTLLQPAGFSTGNYIAIPAGAEVIVLSPRGEVLLHNPNVIFKKNANGITGNDLNELQIKFEIGAAFMKGNVSGLLKIRLFEQRGKKQLRMEMPVIFSKPGEPLQVSRYAKAMLSEKGVHAFINGIEAASMLVKMDTSIKVSPNMAYTSLDISHISGSSMSGIFEGKESFWVYDSDLNEIKIPDMLLKKVKGSLEDDIIDYTLKIPYRLKSNKNKIYFVRFRWESSDKSQLIDVVVAI